MAAGPARLVLALCLAAAPMAARAADVKTFQLPAEPLDAALIRFAVQGAVSVGGLPARGCFGTSRPVAGRMTPAQALAILLPAGCRFEAVDPRSFRVFAQPTAAAGAPAHPFATQAIAPQSLDELVVTAEKRPEFLTRSASAISAVSADEVRSLGARTFDEMAAQMVGVAVTNLGSGRDKIFVRGLSDGSFTGKTQSTVGLYLDDVPITYNAPDPDLSLTDVERVEVLRGPQGTLYGSGSIGGIVRIVTAKPDASAFYGEVSAGGAATEHGAPSASFEGMVNLPLAQGRAAVRAVGYSEQSGGYIDNPVLGLTAVNSSRRSGGRLSARADFGDGWRADAGYAYQSISTADSQYTQGASGPLAREAAVREPDDNDFSEVGVTLAHAGQAADLKISSAFIDHSIGVRYDATGAFRAAGGSRTGGAFDEGKRIKLWTTEGLLSSNRPGPLRWLVGAFASYSDEMDAAQLVGVTPPEPARSIYRRHDRLSEGAVYGEVSYDLTPRLTATAGARWFATRVETTAGDFAIAQAALAPISGHLLDQGLAPKLRLAYAATPSLLVYAQVQEGYRAGGFNIPAAAGGGPGEPVAARFQPDHLWSYEIGAGLPLFDRTLTLRAALFHADWRGLQTDQRLASGLPMTVNIGDGSNTGVEAEATWRPDDRLQVRANLLVEDPQINRAFDAFPARRDIGLPGVPYDMGAADVRYRWRIGRFDAEASAQFAYVGHSFLTFDGGLGNGMGGYGSGRIAAALGAEVWRATAYVDNVADETGNTFAFGNPFSRARATQATPLRPRTFGVGFSRSF
ncbi:MAG TPA: TonB-dependent receptor [Phenylobacterium sp.]